MNPDFAVGIPFVLYAIFQVSSTSQPGTARQAQRSCQPVGLAYMVRSRTPHGQGLTVVSVGVSADVRHHHAGPHLGLLQRARELQGLLHLHGLLGRLRVSTTSRGPSPLVLLELLLPGMACLPALCLPVSPPQLRAHRAPDVAPQGPAAGLGRARLRGGHRRAQYVAQRQTTTHDAVVVLKADGVSSSSVSCVTVQWRPVCPPWLEPCTWALARPSRRRSSLRHMSPLSCWVRPCCSSDGSDSTPGRPSPPTASPPRYHLPPPAHPPAGATHEASPAHPFCCCRCLWQAFLNTHVAAASAMVTWLFCDYWRGNKLSASGACIGVVVGLVGITPAAGFVNTGAAIIIGIVACICSNILGEHMKEKSSIGKRRPPPPPTHQAPRPRLLDAWCLVVLGVSCRQTTRWTCSAATASAASWA